MRKFSLISSGLRGWQTSLLALLLLAMQPVLAAGSFTATELAANLFRVQGPAGNTLIAVDTDGLILVEGVPQEYAAEYLTFARELGGEDTIKALINTHWHPESAGLNAAAAAAGAEVIAHANTRQWLASTIRERGDTILHRPVREASLPTTIFHDHYSLPFRDGSIELGFLLQAHTDGDVYAYFPDQDILFTGPALRQDGWSVVDETTNGFIGGLMDSLALLAEQVIGADTVIVPQSGELMDKEAFEAQRSMYLALVQDMQTLLREARSVTEVLIANPAAGLMPEWGSAEAFLDEGFRSYYGHLRNTRHVGVMP